MREQKSGYIKPDGAKIKDAIAFKGLHLDELADQAGISKRTIQRMMYGKMVTYFSLQQLAHALGTAYESLAIQHPGFLRAKPGSVNSSPTARVVSDWIIAISLKDLDKEQVIVLLKAFKKYAGVKDEIEVFSLIESSIIATLVMNENDTLQAVTALCRGKLDRLNVVEVRLPGNREEWQEIRREYEAISPVSESNRVSYHVIFQKVICSLYSQQWEARQKHLEELEKKFGKDFLVANDIRKHYGGFGLDRLEFATLVLHTITYNIGDDLEVTFEDDGTLKLSKVGVYVHHP